MRHVQKQLVDALERLAQITVQIKKCFSQDCSKLELRRGWGEGILLTVRVPCSQITKAGTLSNILKSMI